LDPSCVNDDCLAGDRSADRTRLQAKSLPTGNLAISAIASAEANGTRRRPIERVRRLTSSPTALRPESGVPVSAAAQTIFFHHQRAGDTATAGRAGRILDRDVVIRHYARNLTPGHFGRRTCC
jgi:hypothetical protein